MTPYEQEREKREKSFPPPNSFSRAPPPRQGPQRRRPRRKLPPPALPAHPRLLVPGLLLGVADEDRRDGGDPCGRGGRQRGGRPRALAPSGPTSRGNEQRRRPGRCGAPPEQGFAKQVGLPADPVDAPVAEARRVLSLVPGLDQIGSHFEPQSHERDSDARGGDFPRDSTGHFDRCRRGRGQRPGGDEESQVKSRDAQPHYDAVGERELGRLPVQGDFLVPVRREQRVAEEEEAGHPKAVKSTGQQTQLLHRGEGGVVLPERSKGRGGLEEHGEAVAFFCREKEIDKVEKG